MAFDKESHYAKKSMRQLQEELKKFQDGKEKMLDSVLARQGIMDFYANHIEYLRMKIAERIGK